MATTAEIMRGISHVMSRAYDGATDEDNNPLSIGLKREEGDPIIDSRVIDGFSIKMVGSNKLCLTYNVEMKIKDVHSPSFETDIESAIKSVKSFVQKEYKKVTKQTLSLKEEGNTQVDVQYISRIRTTVKACQVYKVSGLPDMDTQEGYNLDASIKNWLNLKSDKRPSNDKR